eukprot:m.1539 g.1539  ORF g.1539 m.1539 type:complete len:108 (-) comp1399_c0_seq2:41-364(-)
MRSHLQLQDRSYLPVALIFTASFLLLLLTSSYSKNNNALAQTPPPCVAGSFFDTTLQTCLGCQAGYYCEGNVTAPAPCPAGTSNSKISQNSSSACTVITHVMFVQTC